MASGSASAAQAPVFNQRESFTFFYSKDSPFSQFHRCTFKGIPLFEDTQEYTFNCSEQWMMLNKALLFKDFDIAKEIIKSGWQPLYLKNLGRQVKNFDETIWQQNNRRIVYEGNKLKFSQNPRLLSELMSTHGTTLAEASASDKIWGIGLRATDQRAFCRGNWKGTNILGEILTKLRDELTPSSPSA
jgi:ribA/ribD-fused uncharacterized protein